MLKIMKFSAEWCGPCKRLSPIFEKIKLDTQDVEFEEIDVNGNPITASKFKIMSIPTMVFVKDDIEVGRLVGLVKEDDIRKLIEDLK